MDVCPPDIRFSHYLHSSLHCPSIHLSFSLSPLHNIHPCTLSHHPSTIPLFFPSVLSPLLHTLDLSHHLCSALPFLYPPVSLQHTALFSFLSPDITSNHIFNSSLQSSLSTHPSLPVSIHSPPFSSPADIRSSPLPALHTVHSQASVHLSQTGHVQESVSVTLVERHSAHSITVHSFT